MRFQERYRRLTLWNKVAFWGSLASIFGLLLAVATMSMQRAPTTAPQSPTELTPTQRQNFAHVLLAAPQPRESIRMGCAGADERACVLATQFLELFQQSGWSVVSNGVERVQLSSPRSGIVLLRRGTSAERPPAGSGVWVLQTPSLLTLENAFGALGLPVNKAADAAMPDGVIGVFVGPTP